MYLYDQDISGIFKRAFELKPSKPFIVFGDHKITYGELRQEIGKYTSYFHNNGFRRGDIIVFSSSNEPFICLFIISMMANGITTVNLDPETGSKRANAIINHCRPKAVFLEEETRRKWHLTTSGNWPIISIVHKANSSALDRLLKKKNKEDTSFPSCIKALPSSEIPDNLDPESDALILFTSGTTSAPKGVRLSYRAIFSHMASLANVYRFDKNTRLFNHLMLSHTDGLTQGPLLSLFAGITLYRPFNFSIQRIEEIFDVIYREKISHWLLVPTMISLIYQFKQNDSDVLDHDDFKYAISCGGMLEVKIWTDFEKRFKTMIINGYGLTETVAGGIFAGPEEDTHLIGTIGKPVDCEAMIVDENGDELPIGEKGELRMKGSLLMSGYYRAPEANNAVFSNGWLKTGDLSFKGEDGCFRIVGRIKSAIVSGGVLIIPEEVTEVLNTHPSILESVTFAMEDEVWGEKVTSAVVAKKDTSLKEQEVMDYCRQQLEPRKTPAKVYFMDQLPRGRSGKVMLPSVKEKVIAIENEETASNTEGPDFLKIISQSLQIPQDKISLSMEAEVTPEWDSIRHLVMIADLEQNFDISFSPVEVMNIKSLSDLKEIVEEKVKA